MIKVPQEPDLHIVVFQASHAFHFGEACLADSLPQLVDTFQKLFCNATYSHSPGGAILVLTSAALCLVNAGLSIQIFNAKRKFEMTDIYMKWIFRSEQKWQDF